MLKPSSRSLTEERILAYGQMGSGKSNGWATLRRWYELTNTPGHFYIISTEWRMAHRTAEGYTDGTPGNNFFSNASIDEAWDYETLTQVMKDVGGKAGPEDWIVLDSVSNHWQWVQDDYANKYLGATTMGEARADRTNVEVNWQKINATYRNLVLPIFTRHPAHVYACAQGDTVTSEGNWKDSKEVQAMFARYGMKPVGQKQLGYQFHTVLLMKQTGKDEWSFTSVDDPSREKVNGAPMRDFVLDYMLPIGGWTLED